MYSNDLLVPVMFLVYKIIDAWIDVVSIEKSSVCLDKLNTHKDNTASSARQRKRKIKDFFF